MTRVYQNVPLETGVTLSLDEQASHHVGRVLRAVPGDPLTVFNGKGGEYKAHVTEIKKKQVCVMIDAFENKEAESSLNLCLAQGIARGEKMDFIVQKAVELGVKQIVPLITERCNVRLDKEREEKRLLHWQSVIVSACEQSGRNRLPQISAPTMLAEWLASAHADVKFVLAPEVGTSLPRQPIVSPGASIALLIGPEGGLSQAEIGSAQQVGFTPLTIGPRILRTETATLAAITIVQCIHGDMVQQRDPA